MNPGVGRTGAHCGHRSGGAALAFATAVTVPHDARPTPREP